MMPQSPSTIFHVTHWKAGSQWIYRVLREVAEGRTIVPPNAFMDQMLKIPIVEGAIYPTAYVDKETFDSIHKPENSKHFVIVRDLRDTVVSAYFSVRYSHGDVDNVLDVRSRLEAMNVEDGLIMMVREWLPPCARIQRSWAEAGERLIKYEDLLVRDEEILENLLVDHCGIDVSHERLMRAVQTSRFSSMTRGRERGNEDILAHERKGIEGDWKNHFTPKVTKTFNEMYADVLLLAGYEPF